jgi:hypothetical protein
MDRVETMLAERLGADDVPPYLDPGLVLGAVTRRRSRARRRAVAAAAAGVAVLLAAVATGVAVLQRQETVPTRPGGLTNPADSVEQTVYPVALVFDGDRGAATLGTCHVIVRLFGGPCDYRVATTTDGGRTWRIATLPESNGHPPPTPFLVGERTIVADSLDGPARWVSRDSGRSWTKTGKSVEGTTGSVPDGSPVLGFCPGPDDGRCDAVPIVLTEDGTATRLDVAEPAGLALDQVDEDLSVLAEDGSVWLSDHVSLPRTGDILPAVAVSRDRGRTWVNRAVPAPGEIEGVTTVDGVTAYAVVTELRPSTAAPETETQTVVRTSDGGLTWDPMALPPESDPDPNPSVDSGGTQWSVAALPDGGALLADSASGDVYRTDATGTRFTPAPGVPRLTEISPVRGGYLGTGGRHVWYSTNGDEWAGFGDGLPAEE